MSPITCLKFAQFLKVNPEEVHSYLQFSAVFQWCMIQDIKLFNEDFEFVGSETFLAYNHPMIVVCG
jgi:hypothetical protein